MHEMGHMFTISKKYCHEPETMAEFMVAYAKAKLENDKKYGQNWYNKSLRAFRAGNIQRSSENSEAPSAYRFYIFGLVERVGYEPFKKAFHSYMGKENYSGPGGARDLLGRIEYFSGIPGVCRTLGDNGTLLDKFFNQEIKESNKTYLALDSRTGLPKNTAPTVATAPQELTTPKTTLATTPPAPPAPSKRSYVNPAFQELRSVP